MKVWIDIVNSPHVLFFQPIINALDRNSNIVSITTRAYAQTIGMLDELGMDYVEIGAHAGARLTDKISNLFSRTIRLHSYARTRNFDLALTFNSASLVLAARILRIPSVVIMDYEYQPLNHFTFRICDRVITPEIFPRRMLQKYGAIHKTRTFSGFKEQLYLSKSLHQTGLLKELSINPRRIVVTVRPPATMALYHHFENEFFYTVIAHILKNRNVAVIGLPRDNTQKNLLLSLGAENMHIPDDAVDGRQLLQCTDIMISAGGTMNREAAILGIPTYSVFKGKIGAVDRHLIERGRIIPVLNHDDIQKIELKKGNKQKTLHNETIQNQIVEIIERFGRGNVDR
jgi:predicted glycosyltransferase